MYGNVFRDARKAKRLSVRKLAAATKVSRRYLTLIDQDDANVSLKYLIRVAAALGIPEIRVDTLRVVLHGQDVTGLVMSELAEAIERLSAIQDLLLAPSERSAEDDSGLVADIIRSHRDRADAHSLAETPFAGRYVTSQTLPRGRSPQTLWSSEWSIPTEAFFPVAYAYPQRENDRFLRTTVLDDSMAPELRQGDVVRIDTAVRAPREGDLVAVHGMLSGSVLGVLQSEEMPVLVRPNGDHVPIWRERFVVQGVASKVA